MKVVQLITGSADFGGAQAHVRDLASGLQAHGHECVVIVGPPDGLFSGQLRALGIQVQIASHLRKALHPLTDLRAVLELVTLLKRHKPDLVAAHTAKAGFLGRIACALLGIPCVFTPHGWSIVNRATGTIDRKFKALEKLGGVLGAGVITVCHDEQETGRASGLVARDKLFCVHNGIPDSGVRANSSDDILTIVMVARFHKQKDHATLLRALGGLREYPWRLKLVGSGPLLESTRQLAGSLGIADRVDFLGECRNTPEILGQSAIFILSTFYEAFPISILEAMRAGLPIVATDVGGISEAVSHGVNGLLVPPSRDDSMAASLKRLLLDPSLRRTMGDSGRALFLERFTDKQMVLATLEVYRVLISRKSKHRQSEAMTVPASTATSSPLDPSL